MLILGVLIVVGTIILAYVAHYFLNIKRTSSGGVIEVKGFWDYIGHGVLSFVVKIVLSATLLAGIGLILVGLAT